MSNDIQLNVTPSAEPTQHGTQAPTVIRKFISRDDVRITPGVGCDDGLRAITDAMGAWRSLGIDNIYSNTLKAWNGLPRVLGWLITVEL